jgi:hypothetical protein
MITPLTQYVVLVYDVGQVQGGGELGGYIRSDRIQHHIPSIAR